MSMSLSPGKLRGKIQKLYSCKWTERAEQVSAFALTIGPQEVFQVYKPDDVSS